MKQNWTCTGCEVKSTVDIPDGASIMKNYNIIESDHQRISPECNNPVVRAEVLNIGPNHDVVVRVVEEKIGKDCAHYWVWQVVPEEIRCNNCDEPMAWGEVERRINAAGHLNAQYAKELAGALERLGFLIGAEYLRHYVKALEDEAPMARDATVKTIPPDMLPSDKGGLAQKAQNSDG